MKLRIIWNIITGKSVMYKMTVNVPKGITYPQTTGAVMDTNLLIGMTATSRPEEK